MNKEELFNGISGIRGDILEEAEKYTFGTKRKNSWRKWAVMVAILCVVVGSVLTVTSILNHGGEGKQGSGKTTIIKGEDLVNIAGEDSPEPSYDTKSEYLYSELTGGKDQTDGNEPNNQEFSEQGSTARADLAGFNESMLSEQNCIAIVEGKITNRYQKEYEYSFSSNKFGEDGVMHGKDSTMVYEVTISKIWSRDFDKSKTLIVEDQNISMDEVLPMQIGHSYVLPLFDYGNEIIPFSAGNEEVLSGNLKRESRYSTIYPFHPQIESVEKGYILSADWKSLTADKATPVIMDTNFGKGYEYYKDKMVFLSERDFAEKMEYLMKRYHLK